jgi:hypothetical protein
LLAHSALQVASYLFTVRPAGDRRSALVRLLELLSPSLVAPMPVPRELCPVGSLPLLRTGPAPHETPWMIGRDAMCARLRTIAAYQALFESTGYSRSSSKQALQFLVRTVMRGCQALETSAAGQLWTEASAAVSHPAPVLLRALTGSLPPAFERHFEVPGSLQGLWLDTLPRACHVSTDPEVPDPVTLVLAAACLRTVAASADATVGRDISRAIVETATSVQVWGVRQAAIMLMRLADPSNVLSELVEPGLKWACLGATLGLEASLSGIPDSEIESLQAALRGEFGTGVNDGPEETDSSSDDEAVPAAASASGAPRRAPRRGRLTALPGAIARAVGSLQRKTRRRTTRAVAKKRVVSRPVERATAVQLSMHTHAFGGRRGRGGFPLGLEVLRHAVSDVASREALVEVASVLLLEGAHLPHSAVADTMRTALFLLFEDVALKHRAAFGTSMLCSLHRCVMALCAAVPSMEEASRHVMVFFVELQAALDDLGLAALRSRGGSERTSCLDWKGDSEDEDEDDFVPSDTPRLGGRSASFRRASFSSRTRGSSASSGGAPEVAHQALASRVERRSRPSMLASTLLHLPSFPPPPPPRHPGLPPPPALPLAAGASVSRWQDPSSQLGQRVCAALAFARSMLESVTFRARAAMSDASSLHSHPQCTSDASLFTVLQLLASPERTVRFEALKLLVALIGPVTVDGAAKDTGSAVPASPGAEDTRRAVDVASGEMGHLVQTSPSLTPFSPREMLSRLHADVDSKASDSKVSDSTPTPPRVLPLPALAMSSDSSAGVVPRLATVEANMRYFDADALGEEFVTVADDSAFPVLSKTRPLIGFGSRSHLDASQARAICIACSRSCVLVAKALDTNAVSHEVALNESLLVIKALRRMAVKGGIVGVQLLLELLSELQDAACRRTKAVGGRAGRPCSPVSPGATLLHLVGLRVLNVASRLARSGALALACKQSLEALQGAIEESEAAALPGSERLLSLEMVDTAVIEEEGSEEPSPTPQEGAASVVVDPHWLARALVSTGVARAALASVPGRTDIAHLLSPETSRRPSVAPVGASLTRAEQVSLVRTAALECLDPLSRSRYLSEFPPPGPSVGSRSPVSLRAAQSQSLYSLPPSTVALAVSSDPVVARVVFHARTVTPLWVYDVQAQLPQSPVLDVDDVAVEVGSEGSDEDLTVQVTRVGFVESLVALLEGEERGEGATEGSTRNVLVVPPGSGEGGVLDVTMHVMEGVAGYIESQCEGAATLGEMLPPVVEGGGDDWLESDATPAAPWKDLGPKLSLPVRATHLQLSDAALLRIHNVHRP